MRCKNCNKRLPDGATFCPSCGENVHGYNVTRYASDKGKQPVPVPQNSSGGDTNVEKMQKTVTRLIITFFAVGTLIAIITVITIASLLPKSNAIINPGAYFQCSASSFEKYTDFDSNGELYTYIFEGKENLDTVTSYTKALETNPNLELYSSIKESQYEYTQQQTDTYIYMYYFNNIAVDDEGTPYKTIGKVYYKEHEGSNLIVSITTKKDYIILKVYIGDGLESVDTGERAPVQLTPKK